MPTENEKPRNNGKTNGPDDDLLDEVFTDEFNEKLDRLCKEARSGKKVDNPGNEVPVPESPAFVEFATMFKVESRPSLVMDDVTPRNLECVCCGVLLLWSTYRLDPPAFDRKCLECGVRARDFYKTRPHRDLNDAEERDDRGIPEADLPGPD